MLGIPHFAPDGLTYFVSGYDGSYDNWLAIGSVASDPPVLLWEQGPNVHQGWEFARWVGNDRVALRESAQNEGCPKGNCEGILRRDGIAWTLERLPPASRN